VCFIICRQLSLHDSVDVKRRCPHQMFARRQPTKTHVTARSSKSSRRPNTTTRASSHDTTPPPDTRPSHIFLLTHKHNNNNNHLAHHADQVKPPSKPSHRTKTATKLTNPLPTQSPHPHRQRDRAGHRARLQGTLRAYQQRMK
jgi:hypothetical protein